MGGGCPLKSAKQGGITCGAIDEPRKTSKAIALLLGAIVLIGMKYEL